MKAFHVLLITILISLTAAELECLDETFPTRAKDCNERTVAGDYVKCCYVKYYYFSNGEFINSTRCSPIRQYDLEILAPKVRSIRDHIKTNGGVVESYIYDCSSNYLYMSLLSLILILL